MQHSQKKEREKAQRIPTYPLSRCTFCNHFTPSTYFFNLRTFLNRLRVSCMHHDPLLPNELIDIYLRLWVKMQYFFIIYHSNCSSFSHCELFQIPFMCFRHALISTVFLIKFLLDSTMGYSRLILYFPPSVS